MIYSINSRLGVPPWPFGRKGVPGYDDVDVWEADVAGNNGQTQYRIHSCVCFSRWFVTDQWTITAAFRWTEEEKDFVGGASRLVITH